MWWGGETLSSPTHTIEYFHRFGKSVIFFSEFSQNILTYFGTIQADCIHRLTIYCLIVLIPYYLLDIKTLPPKYILTKQF